MKILKSQLYRVVKTDRMPPPRATGLVRGGLWTIKNTVDYNPYGGGYDA